MSRLAAIAGAAGGLGPAVVERLGLGGWELSAVDRGDYDLLDFEQAQSWADSLDRVDALVHLVGGWRGGTAIDETPAEDVEWLHDLLVRTVQNTTRAFLPALRRSGGRFVLVSSLQAQRPDAKNAAYAASKAAAEAWTLALAADLAEHGGTANILVVNAIGEDKASFTSPADLAEAIAFVLGERGAKMNGQRLSLHG